MYSGVEIQQFFNRGAWGEKEEKFRRLVKAFLIWVAESYRMLYLVHFLSREVPYAAIPPRALQCEPRRENRMMPTIVFRAI